MIGLPLLCVIGLLLPACAGPRTWCPGRRRRSSSARSGRGGRRSGGRLRGRAGRHAPHLGGGVARGGRSHPRCVVRPGRFGAERGRAAVTHQRADRRRAPRAARSHGGSAAVPARRSLRGRAAHTAVRQPLPGAGRRSDSRRPHAGRFSRSRGGAAVEGTAGPAANHAGLGLGGRTARARGGGPGRGTGSQRDAAERPQYRDFVGASRGVTALPPGVDAPATGAGTTSGASGGVAGCRGAFVAAGRALGPAFSSSELPVERRRDGDPALGLGFGLLFGDLLSDPGWLATSPASQRVEEIVQEAALRRLLLLRRCAGQLRYELSLSTLPPGEDPVAPDGCGCRRTVAGTRRHHARVGGEGLLEHSDPELTALHELRAQCFAAQLAEFLRHEFGRAFWKERRCGELLEGTLAHRQLSYDCRRPGRGAGIRAPRRGAPRLADSIA